MNHCRTSGSNWAGVQKLRPCRRGFEKPLTSHQRWRVRQTGASRRCSPAIVWSIGSGRSEPVGEPGRTRVRSGQRPVSEQSRSGFRCAVTGATPTVLGVEPGVGPGETGNAAGARRSSPICSSHALRQQRRACSPRLTRSLRVSRAPGHCFPERNALPTLFISRANTRL